MLIDLHIANSSLVIRHAMYEKIIARAACVWGLINRKLVAYRACDIYLRLGGHAYGGRSMVANRCMRKSGLAGHAYRARSIGIPWLATHAYKLDL